MRLIRTIIVLLVLFLLPLVSWLYLKSGKDWRQKALEELGEKTLMPSNNCKWNGSVFNPEYLSGKVNAIVKAGDGNDEAMEKIYSQFGDNQNARFFILIPEEMEYPSLRNDHGQGLHLIRYRQGDACDSLIATIFPENAEDAILIDREGMIRKRYNLASEGSLKDLVRHFAVLLPVERRDKVELKRERENGSN